MNEDDETMLRSLSTNLLVDNTHAVTSGRVNRIGFTPLQWAVARDVA